MMRKRPMVIDLLITWYGSHLIDHHAITKSNTKEGISMARVTMRRYIFIDDKVKRIGINRELQMPEKACEKIPEMHIFLNQNNEVFEVQFHYTFLDTNGNVDYDPHNKEVAYIIEKYMGLLPNKVGGDDNIIYFPIKVKTPEKYSKAVQAFADTFVEKKYGTKADFNIFLDNFLKIKNSK